MTYSHVELADVGLHPRGDGVALRPARDHEVDGLAGAVLARVGAVAADAAQVEDRVDGRAEPGGVVVQADVAALARDARAVRGGRCWRSRRTPDSDVVGLATGFGLGLGLGFGLATALTPATPTCSGASGAASSGADDGRSGHEPGPRAAERGRPPGRRCAPTAVVAAGVARVRAAGLASTGRASATAAPPRTPTAATDLAAHVAPRREKPSGRRRTAPGARRRPGVR